MSNSTLKAQGSKAFIWDFSGKMAMHGMGFVVSIFLARLLEPSDFGLIAMVMVVIAIAGIFSDVGLGSALIQRRRVLPIHYSSVFFFNISVGMILSLLIYLFAPYIANFYDNEALVPLAQVVSVLFVINAFSSVQSTKLRKELNYTLLTKANFLAALLSGSVGIGMAVSGFGVWSLVAQSLTQAIAYNIVIWLKSHWKPEAAFSLKALQQLWAFGFRMFLSGLIETVYARMDTLIIGKLFAPAVLGFFNRAKALDNMVITYSSGSLMSVLFPVLSKVQKNLERFQQIILKSLGVIVFVVFFLLGGLYLVSHELVILLYGEKWLTTVEYFKILVLSGFGYPVSALLVNVLSSRGNSKAFLRLEVYKKIIGFTNLAVAFRWGIDGYLYGLVIVTYLTVYLNIVFVSREIFLTQWSLVKPIVIQMLIAVSATFVVVQFNQHFTFGNFTMLVFKGCEYTILYIMLNRVFKTEPYRYIMNEFVSAFEKLKVKRRKR